MKKGVLGLFILVVLFVIFWPSYPDQGTPPWGLIVVGVFVLNLIYFLVTKTRRKPPEDIPRSPSETSLPKKDDKIDLTP